MKHVDLHLQQATVVDGTGRPAFVADVTVTGGRIDAVGGPPPGSADRTIDAKGLVVTPGFIDIHTHSDVELLRHPHSTDKLLQGVTTDVLGNCGYALFPTLEPTAEVARDMLGNLWGPIADDELFLDLDHYFQRLEQQGLSTNVVQQATAAMARIAVLGGENRAPSSDEQRRMDALLEQQFEQGACGVSSGLIYAPGCYAEIDELTSLAKVAARHGRMVSTHIRGEGDTLDAALAEAVETARRSGASFQISHLKAVGPRRWGSMPQWLEWLDGKIAEGVALHFDAYPYDAGSTTLAALLPPEALQGGMESTLSRLRSPEKRREIVDQMKQVGQLYEQVGPDRVVLTAFRRPEHAELVGKSLAEVAREWSADPAEVVCELIERERGQVTTILYHMDARDMRTVYQHPRQMVGSDGIPSKQGRPHPRQYATYVRVLEEFVLKEKLMSLETAVRKMTALPAAKVGLTDRGRLAPGLAADLVVLDLKRLHDPTTYTNPFVPVEGIQYVFVNGQAAVENGRYTGALAGKPLRIG